MIKLKIKEATLANLFKSRKAKAINEYKAAVTGTNLEGMMVNYRNILSNPLGLKPKEIIGCVDLDEESEAGKALDRYTRVLEEVAVADGYLTYVLNFATCVEDFDHIVSGGKIDVKNGRLHIFMEQNQDKIQFFRRMRLLAECTT